MLDPQTKGVERAVALYQQRKFAGALEAYRDYFFEKIIHPEKFGITALAFHDDSRAYMSVRRLPESWAAEALQGITPIREVSASGLPRQPLPAAWLRSS